MLVACLQMRPFLVANAFYAYIRDEAVFSNPHIYGKYAYLIRICDRFYSKNAYMRPSKFSGARGNSIEYEHEYTEILILYTMNVG